MKYWMLVLIVLQHGGPNDGVMRKSTYAPEMYRYNCIESAIKMLRHGRMSYSGQSVIAAWCEEVIGDRHDMD